MTIKTGVVLRLVPQKDQYVPKGTTVPTWRCLDPSSRDKEEAQQRQAPVRVSVWDRSLTTMTQAFAHRGRTDLHAYEASVGDLWIVANQQCSSSFDVRRDPCIGTGDLHAAGGCDGHCGIEGLDTATNPSKLDRMSFLADLAKAFRPAK